MVRLIHVHEKVPEPRHLPQPPGERGVDDASRVQCVEARGVVVGGLTERFALV